jgi:hypothetical protein
MINSYERQDKKAGRSTDNNLTEKDYENIKNLIIKEKVCSTVHIIINPILKKILNFHAFTGIQLNQIMMKRCSK